jgi:hypothetical protein
MAVGSSPTDPAICFSQSPQRSAHVRVVQRPSTPVFPTGNTGSIPVTDAQMSRRCRTAVSTPVSLTGNTGSIPVTDTSRAAGAWLSSSLQFADLIRVSIPSAVPRPSFSAVRAGHRDSSFLSARRFDSVDCDHGVAPQPQCLFGGELARREVSGGNTHDRCGHVFRAPCRGSPTRTTTGSTPVRSTPWACRRRYGTLLVREHPSRLPHSGARDIFLCSTRCLG